MSEPSPRARALFSRAQLAWPAGDLAAAAAVVLRPGPLAGALAIAFVGCAAVAATAGADALLTQGRPRYDVLPTAALAALVAGGVWFVLDRFGWDASSGAGAPGIPAAHLLVGSFGSLLLAWLALRCLPLGRYQRGAVEASASLELVAAVVMAAGLGRVPTVAAVVAVGLTIALIAVAAVTSVVAARLEDEWATWGLFAASLLSLAVATVPALGHAVARVRGTAVLADMTIVAWHGVASTVGFVLLGLVAWSLAIRRGGEPAAHLSEG